MNADAPPPVRQIIAPEWLAHRYDPVHDAVHLVRADRSERRAAPFLIDAELSSTANPLIARRENALAATTRDIPTHFVFHSAYCCSTLLANMLDRPGIATSFKEPTILNDLVGWRHRGATQADTRRIVTDVLDILARPFATGEAVVIKPSNVVNGLAIDLMGARPDARCILLYAPLEVYLGSIAAKGMWGRLWVRELFVKQLRDGLHADLGLSLEDQLGRTDLQIAAVGWLIQHRLFQQMAGRWPDRARLLNSETLLQHPGESLRAIGGLFGLSMSTDAVQAIVGSDVLKRNAKDGKPYDPQARRDAQDSATRVHAEELANVAAWARELADGMGIDVDNDADHLRLIPDHPA